MWEREREIKWLTLFPIPCHRSCYNNIFVLLYKLLTGFRNFLLFFYFSFCWATTTICLQLDLQIDTEHKHTQTKYIHSSKCVVLFCTTPLYSPCHYICITSAPARRRSWRRRMKRGTAVLVFYQCSIPFHEICTTLDPIFYSSTHLHVGHSRDVEGSRFTLKSQVFHHFIHFIHQFPGSCWKPKTQKFWTLSFHS